MSFGSDNHHIGKILGGGTDERYAAYIYFLDDVLFGSIRIGNGLAERVEVYYNEVYFRYGIFYCLLSVVGIVTAHKDSAHHSGMERLDPSAENRRVASQAFHCSAFKALLFDEFMGSPCGIKLYAFFAEKLEYREETVFMIDRD